MAYICPIVKHWWLYPCYCNTERRNTCPSYTFLIVLLFLQCTLVCRNNIVIYKQSISLVYVREWLLTLHNVCTSLTKREMFKNTRVSASVKKCFCFFAKNDELYRHWEKNVSAVPVIGTSFVFSICSANKECTYMRFFFLV